MEAFLLNPDVTVQPSSKLQSTGDNGSTQETEGFNPVLEEAVANQEGFATGRKEKGEGNTPQGHTGTEAEQLLYTEGTEAGVPGATPANLFASVSTAGNSIPQVPFATAAIPPEIASETVMQPLPKTIEPEALLLTNSHPSPSKAGKAETILLQQIQQIIDEGKNIGAISVKASNPSNTTPAEESAHLQSLSSMILDESEPELIQVRQTGNYVQILPGEQQKSLNLNVAKPESGRQDITEQFLNAKISDSKSNTEGQSGNQQQDTTKGGEGQQNKPASLNTPIGTAATSSDTTGAETSFSQHLRAGEISSTTTSTPIEGKFAPGSTHATVPERELVNHLIQRFNVNPRLQTSKLTMQLHPAELGQIKIDILVKGDSLSANIVAQSQQVLETLDKNMNRLRGVLQEQGFTVDSFEITLQADEDKQQNLFQEHFDSQQQLAENMTKNSAEQDNSFDALLASETDSEEQTETGVNVTA